MRYISICSGIEAASVAWHGLGWTPLAFAEIEPFPSAVLAHHHPDVPNLGDMSKYREWPESLLVECDLLVGGTPCQAFSVAGLRKSLDDDRGNLSLIYVQLFHHINDVRRKHGRAPAIAVWENVPGVLSTKDNAFGCFVSGLLGVDETIETEDGKWPKAGFFGSETVRVGYRILDAQYFAVAQRRRRVFLIAVPCELVASLGERACPSEILSLRESVLGNPPTRGAAREGAAAATQGGAASGVYPCLDANVDAKWGCNQWVDRAMFNQGVNAQFDPQITQDGVAGSMVARGPAAVMWSASDQANAERMAECAGTLNCNKGQRGGWISEGFPDPAYALSAGNQSKGGVFGSGRDSQDTFVTQAAVCATGDKTHALTTRSAAEEDGTGRGTQIIPVNSLGFNWQNGGGYGAANDGLGITEEVTPPLSADADKGDQDTIVAFKPGQSEAAVAFFATNGFSPTLQSQNNGSTAVPAVAYTKAKRAQSNKDDETWVQGDVAPTQNQFDVGDTRATTVVAFTQNSRDEVRQINDDGQIVGALSAGAGMHQTNYIAFANRTRDGIKVPEVMKDGVTPALTNPGGGGRSDAINVLAEAPVQVQWASGGGKVENPTMQALRTSAEHNYQFVRHAMQVRRLTPKECCRLQGFPDDRCDITFRKKPAADGPKYRALGNSMAVPCMYWVGWRIAKATSP